MSKWVSWARYGVAKARSSLHLYDRVLESGSSREEAYKLALNDLRFGRLCFVHSEPKDDAAASFRGPREGGGDAAAGPRHGDPGGPLAFQDFPRRHLVRRILAPGPKCIFVGDLVLVQLELDAIPCAQPLGTSPAVSPLAQSAPAIHQAPPAGHARLVCEGALRPEVGPRAADGGGAAQAWASRLGLADSSQHPASAGSPSPPCGPLSRPGSEGVAAPAPSAAVLRRVGAMEGAEMVSDDPQDPPFRIPRGHCWLLQEDTPSPLGSATRVAPGAEEWDSRRTGPVPCSQILGRAIYVCHSPVHHEPVTNSAKALWRDAPVLAVELDVERLCKGSTGSRLPHDQV